MIQRRQSIYLLLATALIVCSYFFPFGYVGDAVLRSYGVKHHGQYIADVSSYWFHLPLFIVCLLLLIAFFSFTNRKRQMALLRGTYIFYVVSFSLLAFFVWNAQHKLQGEFQAGISLFMAFAAMLFGYLALRAIRQDEELVRSADRIR
ncbi:MAG: DUF4293 domain-containing protein [Flavobacteriales bacterium]